MASAPTPTPTQSPISLTTVGSEIAFLANYVTDLLSVPVVPALDKQRVSALLSAAVADLNTAVTQLKARLHLGTDPIIDDKPPQT